MRRSHVRFASATSTSDARLRHLICIECAIGDLLHLPKGGLSMLKRLMLASVLIAVSSPVLAAEPDPIGDVVKAAEGIVMIPITLVDEMTK